MRKDLIKDFELTVLRPLFILFVLAAIYLLLRGNFLPFMGCGAALFYLGLIGSQLHPTQSALDLAKGPLTNPMAEFEAQLLTDKHRQMLIGPACTKVGILVGVLIMVFLGTILGWRWYFSIPAGCVALMLSGAFLKFFFTTLLREE